MPKQTSPRLHLSVPARRDIVEILNWSFEQFGRLAVQRYRELIEQALRDIRENPKRPGLRERPELMVEGARTYHLSMSQDLVAGVRVKAPRHLILYRILPSGVIVIGRVLHDGRDLQRHLPQSYKLPPA